jgi:hypothetical protein
VRLADAPDPARRTCYRLGGGPPLRIIGSQRRRDVVGVADAAASTTASSSAWQAPCPRSGVIACAASPSSATRPGVNRGNGWEHGTDRHPDEDAVRSRRYRYLGHSWRA